MLPPLPPLLLLPWKDEERRPVAGFSLGTTGLSRERAGEVLRDLLWDDGVDEVKDEGGRSKERLRRSLSSAALFFFKNLTGSGLELIVGLR